MERLTILVLFSESFVKFGKLMHPISVTGESVISIILNLHNPFNETSPLRWIVMADPEQLLQSI